MNRHDDRSKIICWSSSSSSSSLFFIFLSIRFKQVCSLYAWTCRYPGHSGAVVRLWVVACIVSLDSVRTHTESTQAHGHSAVCAHPLEQVVRHTPECWRHCGLSAAAEFLFVLNSYRPSHPPHRILFLHSPFCIPLLTVPLSSSPPPSPASSIHHLRQAQGAYCVYIELNCAVWEDIDIKRICSFSF